MCVFRASGGSEEGLEAFCEWSAKNTLKHDEDTTRARWEYWTSSSPPTKCTAGSLFWRADAGHGGTDWRDIAKPGAAEEFGVVEVQSEVKLFRIIDLRAWKGRKPPERDWVSLNRIPARNVTLLSGQGGMGKTLIGLDGATSVSLELPEWFGAPLIGGPALVLCCEDDEDELHRRIAAIAEHHMVDYDALIGRLHLISMAEASDPLLALPDGNDIMRPTRLFKQLREAAFDIRPRLVLIDNSADVFGGNENDRKQVRQFIGLLRGVALGTGAGVLLNSHPSLSGIASGSGLSGSTHWHNAVRSRMYLRAPNGKPDEEGLGPDFRILEVMKNNYGPASEKLIMRWRNGLFVPVGAGGPPELAEREALVEKVFLEILGRFEKQNRIVSAKGTARNNAPSEFGFEPDAIKQSITKGEFQRAMTRLFAADSIKIEEYGPPSQRSTKIVGCK